MHPMLLGKTLIADGRNRARGGATRLGDTRKNGTDMRVVMRVPEERRLHLVAIFLERISHLACDPVDVVGLESGV